LLLPDIRSELLKAIKDETKHIPGIKSMLDEAKQKALKEDLKALADWLSPSTYPAEYAAKLKERQDGTGEWFIRLHEVETWLNTPKSTLLCCGELGTGKSMLCAILIEHLLKTAKSETIGVAWMFIHHNAKEDDPRAKLLAALLKQLVQSHAKIAEHVNTLFKRHVKEETGMSQDDTIKMLDFASAKLTTTYIVIDALDEFTDVTQRDEFVKYLQSLQSFADVRILVTSKFVTKELQSAPRLRVKARSDDIKRYVAGRIHRLPDFVQEDSSLQSQVQEKIASSVGDMCVSAPLFLQCVNLLRL
jgi:archaellum biogenesis ATPase FlaH